MAEFYKYTTIITVFAIFVSQFLIQVQCKSPVGDGGTYKIGNVFNDKYLTVVEEGIVGLRTGIVITANDRGLHKSEQSWTLTWDPNANQDTQPHQGYRIQSKKDFLNAITSYYPEGRSYAHINVWKLKHLGANKWQLQNTRTRSCLSIREGGIEAEEDKCSTKSTRQQWTFVPVVIVPEEDDESHILATNSRFPFANIPNVIPPRKNKAKLATVDQP